MIILSRVVMVRGVIICIACFVTKDVRRFERQERAYGAFQLESLILAQNERWRQALYMQVERSLRRERRTGE